MWKLFHFVQKISVVLLITYFFLLFFYYEENQEELKKELNLNNREISYIQKLQLKNKSSCKIKSKRFGLKLFGKFSFQRIADLPELFFIYSAYFANESETKQIRILGIGETRIIKIIKCRFFDEDNQEYYTSDGRTIAVPEDTGHPVYFYAAFITCTVPKSLKTPSFISIASPFPEEGKNECKISNVLKVQYPHSQMKYEFVACIKPVYKFQETFGLLEWIEFNKLMGIEHFTIYVLSMSREVRCALKSYGSEIEIRDWNPPLRDTPLILENALMVAMNDCLYKYKGLSKYILFSDIDEFIVPNITSNFSTLLKSINDVQDIKNETTVGYYKFENGWFFKCWPDSPLSFTESTNQTMRNIIQNMVLMRKNKLTQPFYSKKYKTFENRTKYIAQTVNTDIAGVHLVWERRNGSLKVQVNEKDAFSHHYRVSWEEDNCLRPAIAENIAHKYVIDVAKRMYSKVSDVVKYCNFTA